MKVLVIGSGGREHALLREIKKSPLVSGLYVWPGSDAFSSMATRMTAQNISSLVQECRNHSIDLVVIGPEAHLVDGCSDELRFAGFSVFGPEKAAAMLEGSKIFAKEFMTASGVPTARYTVVDSVAATMAAANEYKPPFVLKADGLAAGKGVFICGNVDELKQSATQLFEQRVFGEAGLRAIVEEFQPGQEMSLLVLTNGSEYKVLPFSRDHKRLLDDDKGPNTGGMGVVAPVSIGSSLLEEIENQIVVPSINEIKKRKYLYRGILFIGVMLTANGPKVLEYNVRFGDPETQCLLPLLIGDWAYVFKSCADGSVVPMKWTTQALACVVLAAEGYPDAPVKGVCIEGDVTTDNGHNYVLHAGTKWDGKKQSYVTSGGRVLNVMGQGDTLASALQHAYDRANNIHWSGKQMRRDIGKSSLG
jgi:phosphoribosylamine--glycine ligase